MRHPLDAVIARKTDSAPPLVTVCAWCPDAAEQTAAARAHGYEVSHGLCAVHEARLNAELDAAEAKAAAA